MLLHISGDAGYASGRSIQEHDKESRGVFSTIATLGVGRFFSCREISRHQFVTNKAREVCQATPRKRDVGGFLVSEVESVGTPAFFQPRNFLYSVSPIRAADFVSFFDDCFRIAGRIAEQIQY